MFNTIESCDAALTAWQQHVANEPNNMYNVLVVGMLKRKKEALIINQWSDVCNDVLSVLQ